MQSFTKIKIRKDNLVMQHLENEILIYDLILNKAFCLNKTSAMVWELCDGSRSIAEISVEMSRRLNELISEDFVLLALDQFRHDGLLENEKELSNYFTNFSRRSIIKKVGFASLVALPIVSSIIAPQAVLAQSGVAAVGQACTLGNPSTCSTANCLNNSGSGICCSAISAQANNPGYIICTSDASAAAFAVRCCSGNASVAVVQACPNVSDTRYTCDSY